MAVSAANALSQPYKIVGSRKETVYNVTFDESYTEKGEALTASDVGLNCAESASCDIKSIGEGTDNIAEAFFDVANNLIHLYDNTPAEMLKEKDVSKVVVQVTTRGH